MWLYKALINNRDSDFCIGAKHSQFLWSLWGTVTWIWVSFVKVHAVIDHPLGLFNYTLCVKLPYLPPDSNTRDIPICLRLTTFNSNKFSHKESVSFDCGQSQNLPRGFSFNSSWQNTWRCAQMWNHSFPYGMLDRQQRRNTITLHFILRCLSQYSPSSWCCCHHGNSEFKTLGLVFTFYLS